MATPTSKRGKLEINGEYITPTKLRDAHIKLLNKFDMIEQNPFCRMCGKHKPPGDFYKSPRSAGYFYLQTMRSEYYGPKRC